MHIYLPKKYYFINSLDTNLIEKINKETAVIYRNYDQNKFNEKLIVNFKQYCKKKKIKFILSNNVKLSIKLKLDGAYIPSFNKDFQHIGYSYPNNFIILGSAHNLKEIRLKEIQKVQILFISSLFKKNKNFLGLNKFRLLIRYTKKQIVALGGISKNNKKKLRLINCFGFAGISFFR